MKRATLLCVIVAIAIFFDLGPAWARGFGESRGRGGGGGRGAGGGGGGFSHVPTPSRASGGYRAPERVEPRESFHPAPAYHPGPTAHYESHVESVSARLHRPSQRGPAVVGRTKVGRRRTAGPGRRRPSQSSTTSSTIIGTAGTATVGTAAGTTGTGTGTGTTIGTPGWSDWWANPWYARTAFWGVTGWWLGASVYDWGYLPYSNPYYTQSYVFGPTVIDYEQPVQVVDYGEQLPEGPNPPPVSPEATQHADAARQAFYDQNDRLALSEIQRALELMPGRPGLPRVAGPDPLCDGRIPSRRGGHSLAVGGRSRLGLDHDDRPVSQCRHLHEAAPRAGDLSPRPSERRGRAVSAGLPLPDDGAHAGRRDRAAGRRPTGAARPRGGPVALDDHLFAQPGGTAGRSGPVASTRPGGTEPDGRGERGRPSTGDSLNGTWTARSRGRFVDPAYLDARLEVHLALSARGRNRTSSAAPSTVANNLLVLQQGNGESMVGRVVPTGGRGFRFFLVGGPPNDPGLTFTP